jgi:hypothetical protein
MIECGDSFFNARDSAAVEKAMAELWPHRILTHLDEAHIECVELPLYACFTLPQPFARIGLNGKVGALARLQTLGFIHMTTHSDT